MVNEALVITETDARGSKKSPAKAVRAKAGKQAQGPESDFNNAALAAANKATDVRTFAVRRTSSGSGGLSSAAVSSDRRVGGTASQGKWAAGAFANSPAPSTLPKPAFFSTASVGNSVAGKFFDPAIVSSRPLSALPAQAPASDRRVTARFHDGEYYSGTSKGANERGDVLVIFDGYEEEGAYPIPPADVYPLPPPTCAISIDPRSLIPPTAWVSAAQPPQPAGGAAATEAGSCWDLEQATNDGQGHALSVPSAATFAPPPASEARPSPAGPPAAAVGLEELERMLVCRAEGLDLGWPLPPAAGPTGTSSVIGRTDLPWAATGNVAQPPARPLAPHELLSTSSSAFLLSPAILSAPVPAPLPAAEGGRGVGPARSRKPASALLAAALSTERL